MRKLALPIIAGLMAGTMVLLTLISLSAYIFSRIDLPLSMMVPLATLSIGAAVFAAALAFAAIYGRYGMLLGALAGILIFFILCAASVRIYAEQITQLSLIKALLLALCGALGGFFGVNLFQKRHRRNRIQ